MTAFVRRLSLLSIGALLSILAGGAGAAAPQPYLVDGDGDGVSDEIDDCPYTHPGVQVNAKGCPIQIDDSDLDGVPDADDDCPYSDPGAVVDAHGCALDSDFDGVANGLDLCPNTGLSLPVDSKGCAKGERVEVAQGLPKPAASAIGKSRSAPPTAIAANPVAVAPVVTRPVAAPAAVVLPKTPSVNAGSAIAVAAELPKADFKFADNSEHLSRRESSLLQSYAKVFARRLAMNSKSSLHLRAYADHREANVAGLVAARAAVVRTALVARGIAADRIVADSGVLRDGKASDNRRVEVKLGE